MSIKKSWRELGISLTESDSLEGESAEGIRPDPEAQKLFRYRELARPNQLPPEGDWLIWMVIAGRGFGKTWTGANWVVELALSGQYREILISSKDMDSVYADMIYGVSGITSVAPPGFVPTRKVSGGLRMEFPNGVILHLRSPKYTSKIRGMNLSAAWIDEFCYLPDAEKGLKEDSYMMNVLYAMRGSKNPRICMTGTPRPVKLLHDLLKMDRVVVTRGTTYDNADHLPEKYYQIISMYEGTHLGAQEIYGSILVETGNALWKEEWIDVYRVSPNDVPPLDSVCVGVDPNMGGSTSKYAKSSCGIVVVGVKYSYDEPWGNHYYVLADYTTKGTSEVWLGEILRAYSEWSADYVVVESNQGGNLLESLFYQTGNMIPIRRVWASAPKVGRADPVSILYQKGLVHHVGDNLLDLETALITYPHGDTDRVDALVWAITELGGTSTKRSWISPYDIKITI